ncbi:hypothetical protein H70357_30190 [Paenibacillus sp. FSL H7-0357]|nr:hypothetical protein H70357_30190 [Paenibacillus sp. FSL H7-0357]
MRFLVFNQLQRMDLSLFQIPVELRHGFATKVVAESADGLLKRPEGAFDLEPGGIHFDDPGRLQGQIDAS